MRFLFIILTISCLALSSSTWAIEPHNKRVTKGCLQNICYKTSSPSLCYHVLKDLLGFPLAEANFSSLATRPLNLANAHARETRDTIKVAHRGLVHPRREVRDAYRRCLRRYDEAVKLIGDAKGYLQSGEYYRVRGYALCAMNRVHSCERNFAEAPRDLPGLKIGNKKFNDLCNITMTMKYKPM